MPGIIVSPAGSGGGGGGASVGSSTPSAVGSTGSAGASALAAREDHQHAGVASLNGATGALTVAGAGTVTASLSGSTLTLTGASPSVPAGTGVRKVSGGVETVGLVTSADITDGTIVNADISSSAGVTPDKLSAGAYDGQAVVRAAAVGAGGDANLWGTPQCIAYVDLAPPASAQDTTLFTAPASGAKYLVLGVFVVVRTVLTAGTLTVRAGKTVGGQEYLKDVAISTSSTAYGRAFGNLLGTEAGASLPTDGSALGDELATSGSVYVRVTPSGSPTVGAIRVYLMGLVLALC